MSWTNPVIWQEGMFLRAQHFQQLSRWTEAQLRARTAALGPYWWGFTQLTVDQKKLEAGQFALISASGVFIDGTPFAIPFDTDNPASLPLDEKARGTLVYLCMAAPSLDAVQVAHEGNGSGGRYRVHPFSAADTFPGEPGDPSDAAPLLVGRLQLRFFQEQDDRRGWQCLPVARISDVGTDHRITLDKEWIPPVVRADAQASLVTIITDLRIALSMKVERLAPRLPVLQTPAHLADLMFLQAANRWLNLMTHWSGSGGVHPEAVYSAFVQMAGEFGSFLADRRLGDFPPYKHDDLQLSFTRLCADLQRAILHEGPDQAIRIDLEQQKNWFRGQVYQRDLLAPNAATFYLVAKASAPSEQVRREFPSQVTVGEVRQLQALVNAAISGVAVSPLAMNPPQLVYDQAAVYFELDRASRHWEQIRASTRIGLHVTNVFPRIALELWAVRA
nr:type VI secretion system baseplate subunit TssK [uncultured Rhodopila sp.]